MTKSDQNRSQNCGEEKERQNGCKAGPQFQRNCTSYSIQHGSYLQPSKAWYRYMLVPVEQYSPLWPLSADACRWSFAEKPSVVKVWYRPQLKCGTSVVGTMVHTSSLSSASPASSCFASWLGALMRHCMPCVWCLHNLTSPTQKSARECSHLTAWDKISFYFFNESIPGWPVATLCLSIPLISD